MEQLNYNLLFRWFVGLEMDDPVWDVTVFTKNRERLIAGAVSQQLLESVLVEAREHDLLSEEHFTVDGTLIQAWASARSFKDKSDPPAPGAGSGMGARCFCATRWSRGPIRMRVCTRRQRRTRRFASYQGHALMENRNGLVVAAEASQAATVAERETALELLDRRWLAKHKRQRGEQQDHAGRRHAVSGRGICCRR